MVIETCAYELSSDKPNSKLQSGKVPKYLESSLEIVKSEPDRQIQSKVNLKDNSITKVFYYRSDYFAFVSK